MKEVKYLNFWSILFLLFSLISCQNNAMNIETSESIQDALKINVYEYVKEESAYVLQTLELNKPIVIKCNGNGMRNINIQFCFEGGICEVIADNKDMQLSIGQDGDYWASGDLGDSRVYGYEFEVSDERYVTLFPLGAVNGSYNTGAQPDIRSLRLELEEAHNIGREYYLTINAKDYNSTVIKAKIKLVQIADIYTNKEDYIGDFTIELISYEYSYVYDMMQ